MRLLICSAFLGLAMLPASGQNDEPFPAHEPRNAPLDDRLPNGKSRQQEILKSDYQKTLQDVKQIVEISTALEKEMEQSSASVLSLSSLHKAEEIERLSKRIRSRILH